MATNPLDRVVSGRRDTLITMQQLVETAGDSGEPVESWTTLCTLWASMETVDAPERFTEGVVMNQVSARAWIKFTTNYRTDCDPHSISVPKTRRVTYLDRVYDIAAAALIGRKRGIEFLTLSKVG